MIFGCIIGLSLLLYPTVSDYWNSKYVTHAIVDYVARMEELDETDYQSVWEEAKQYNADLRGQFNAFYLSEELRMRYSSCLNVGGDGLMGYIEIPKIDVILPVYHGVSDSVLQSAVGHIEWTSLPTGGVGTHCVLSGHRGLLNAKLFTDLDRMIEGDTFSLNVLGEALVYEVDQIRTVEPTDVGELSIEDDEDYCTLLTCTPYGINTHRLLVRGHRIEASLADDLHIISEAVEVDPVIVAPILAAPILFILLMAVLLKKPEKKRSQEEIIEEIKEKQ